MTERPGEGRAAMPEPTRRQMLAALSGAAVGAGAYGYGGRSSGADTLTEGHPASRVHVETATAVAAAIYPTSVAVEESFVENAVFRRVEPTSGHFEALVDSIEAVDSHARARFGGSVTELSPATRRRVLTSMGVTAVHPMPEGTTAERVRFYLVNDLLYALFTSPRSRPLTGIENPPGHPGGLEAYRRTPEDE
ncbi:gluconate 2-dehydrogenase subunit 3 family protein [Haloarcula laminariae]|uniref:gluconate 2-dehydrogenase subunit 3 family protein n=1 Tax=Haloarcula laminariae TaxID=2961577 RepID=UPI0024055C3D|nr:gluconate 2-dehydrogenase subunit 3 family protein [Halomicroarcula sp. FL173]